MKKVIFLAVLVVLNITAVQAQITTKPVKSQQKTIIQTPPQQPPAVVSVYSLTAVRVNIRTGNDNKEFPSKVLVTLIRKSAPGGDWSPFGQLNLDNEMRINSNTEFGLAREPQMHGEAKLDVFQNDGIKLTIKYLPNFFADAWKIENVSIILEFKDQFGNLHPSLGSKTINFSNAVGFLNNEYRVMECVTDGSFSPLTAVIKQ